MCLVEEHVRSVHEGSECAYCEIFELVSLLLEGQASASRSSGPPAAEAQRRPRSWGQACRRVLTFLKILLQA